MGPSATNQLILILNTKNSLMVFTRSPTTCILTNVKRAIPFVWGGPPTLNRVQHYKVSVLIGTVEVPCCVDTVCLGTWTLGQRKRRCAREELSGQVSTGNPSRQAWRANVRAAPSPQLLPDPRVTQTEGRREAPPVGRSAPDPLLTCPPAGSLSQRSNGRDTHEAQHELAFCTALCS